MMFRWFVFRDATTRHWHLTIDG